MKAYQTIKHTLCALLISCTLVLSQQGLAQTNKIGNSEDFDKIQLQNRQWQKAINDFANASTEEVLTPYMQLISSLNRHPEANLCTDNIMGLINRAIELNPSSLVAYSMLYSCATKQHKLTLKAKYLENINGLISNLVDGKAADSIEDVIEIRELMEAPLLLQAMGYTVLDMDMTTRYGGLYYRYYVSDPLSSKITIRYFSNLQFMKRMLSDPNVTDDTAAQLLAQYYEQQKMDFALNAKARRLVARKQYQQALEVLNSIETYSMSKNVLLGRIFMATNQPEALEQIQRELSFDAKSGFIESSVLLAHIKLTQQKEDYQAQINALLSEVDAYTKPGEGAYRLSLMLQQTDDQAHKNERLVYLKQAVEHDHPEATLLLARIYRSSEGQHQDAKQAMALLEKARDFGDNDAAVEIARFLHQGGQNVAVDHEKELQILRQLADKDNATALYMLAQRYDNAIDVDKDMLKAYQYYMRAYEQGHAKAANQIGILYEIGVVNDKEELDVAYQWYEKASNKGDSNGFSNLARFHHYGIGRAANLSKAANYYIRAAETGSFVAYCRLADTMLQMEPRHSDKWLDTVERARSLYLYGVNGEGKFCPRQLGILYQQHLNDADSAERWLELASQNGDEKANDYLEILYFTSYVDKDYAQALSALEKGAQMGMTKATYYLGEMYHLGLGTERDDAKALSYFEKAAALEYPQAKKALVKLYLQGQDSVKDQARARQLLEDLASRSLAATIRVAEWFFYGWGFEKDYQLALQYYLKAAEQGSGNAINHLGEMYRFGWGVDVDYDAAMQWYQKGMLVNYILCAHNIAEMYYFGEGVEKDYQAAMQWFSKSAATNVSHSRYFIGRMYQNGLGVEQDHQAANRFFYMAMDQRHHGAKFELGKNMINGNGMTQNQGRGLIFITEAAEAGFQEAIDYLAENSAKLQ